MAICTKWKCDIQPIEDCGGVYSYLKFREIAMSPESLDGKAKKELARNYGFKNLEMFKAWLDEAHIDIELINEELAEIPERREDID